MRPGEACGLEWRDVNLNARVITVRQSAWRGKLQPPKTQGSERRFAISARLAQKLTVMQQVSGLLFAYNNGRPWREEKVLEKKLKPLLTALEIECRGLHAFRHFNGTMLDRMNVPVKVRQERLGHSTSAMTLDCYTHVASEDDRRFADDMGEKLCPNVPKSVESMVPVSPQLN